MKNKSFTTRPSVFECSAAQRRAIRDKIDAIVKQLEAARERATLLIYDNVTANKPEETI